MKNQRNVLFLSRFGLAITCLILCAVPAAGEIMLPQVFGDNMVLQREMNIPVWGWANPGEKITVRLGQHEVTAKADGKGNWLAELPSMKAGGPYKMTITGSVDPSKPVRFMNVLIGEVWLCSGQSNMTWGMNRGKDARKEMKEAGYPEIRLFTVQRNKSQHAESDVHGEWNVCGPKTVGSFSAAAYFFGRFLHKELDVPIGLIHSSVSGTFIEGWMTREILKAIPECAEIVDRSDMWLKTSIKKHADNQGLAKGWADLDYKARRWKKMKVPQLWEKRGLKIDGTVWFRKQIKLPSEWEGKDLELSLGAIDDFDNTYFNGVQVGSTGNETREFWAVPRVYNVPGKLVRSGKNLIAVRVFDHYGAGGFAGKKKDMRLTLIGGDKAKPVLLAGKWRYKVAYVMPGEFKNLRQDQYPGCYFNAMIRPLAPYAIRGVIWYQGEGNVISCDGLLYGKKMKALITKWREIWQEEAFPFYFVQIAPCTIYEENELPKLREGQRTVLTVTNTGMVVATDIIDDITNAHSPRKQDIGKRLALWALAKTYGRDKLVCSGPLYKSMTVENNKIRINFDYVGKGLACRDSDNPELTWFEIAGKNNRFVKAQAKIDKDTVVVWSDKVTEPAAVRFGWNKLAQPNLINKEGLPASPFSTQSR